MIFRSNFFAVSSSCGRRAIVPSSFMISISAPAGCNPARRARSTAASVCPGRRSTPLSRARRGLICPGRPRSVGLRFGVGQRADRRGAVVDRDARGAVVAQQVDRHGEGRAQQRGVVLLHHVEPQFVAAFLRQRGAQHAAALLEHEVHDFGRDLLRRDDEVAFVLAVLVVHDDNGFADAEVLDDLLHAIEHSLFCHFV